MPPAPYETFEPRSAQAVIAVPSDLVVSLEAVVPTTTQIPFGFHPPMFVTEDVLALIECLSEPGGLLLERRDCALLVVDGFRGHRASGISEGSREPAKAAGEERERSGTEAALTPDKQPSPGGSLPRDGLRGLTVVSMTNPRLDGQAF